MGKVYIVRNECLTPTSSYNDIIMVTESLDNAKVCLETCKNDTVLCIDNGEHEGFKEDYVLEYDDKVNHLYSRANNQICFSNKEGYYDIYWIEEHELVKMNQEKFKNNIDERYQKLIDSLENMTSFKGGIINVPKMKSKEDYERYVIKNFIRCGAIAKKDLVIGKTYIGSCRNTEEATWLGEYFEYNRTKFGSTFKEKINHFEDDNSYDLFVPFEEK